MRKIRRVSFWNLWLLLFVGGVLGGTIWANLLGRELLEQIGYFDGIFQTGMKMNHEEQWQLCRYVLSQRVGEVCFGGMLAMTPLAVPGYLILSFGTGFGMAVVITVFTLEKGWLGIWYLDYVCHSPWFMLPSNLASLVSSCEGKAGFKKGSFLAVSRYPGDNRWIFGSLGKSLAFRVFIFVEYLLIC